MKKYELILKGFLKNTWNMDGSRIEFLNEIHRSNSIKYLIKIIENHSNFFNNYYIEYSIIDKEKNRELDEMEVYNLLRGN